jgi:Skp family chaperone for outer membrane proteins
MSQEDQRDYEKIKKIQEDMDNLDENFRKDGFNKLISDLEEEKYDKGSIFL